MRNFHRLLGTTAGLGALLLAAACSDSDSTPAPPTPPPSIAEALEAQNLNTLADAIDAAGLGLILEGTGPFTIFAPTDEAFEALPDGLLTALLADQTALSAVLLYHVVSGSAVDSEAALALSSATMANGDDTIIDVVNDELYINDARVTEADVETSNGVVHVIDRVLLPPLTIPAALERAGDFTALLAALDDTSLDLTLEGPGPFTLFAPTDAAFAAVDLSGFTQQEVTDTLLYHTIGDEVTASNALMAELAESIEGSFLFIDQMTGELRVNGTTIVLFNIPTTNGVIHVIDAVLTIPDTIAGIATDAGTFDTLVAALDAAGLAGDLGNPDAGPFTVFAPTDTAFAALPAEVVTWLDGILADPQGADQVDLDALTELLQFHAAPSLLTANGVQAALADTGIETLLVGTPITADDLNGVEILTANIIASNGIVHAIDTVLVPDGFAIP
jgi:uncharacterized surface protein with fasciclin (FAS1) repeats